MNFREVQLSVQFLSIISSAIADFISQRNTRHQIVLISLESVTPSKRTRISFPPIKEQKKPV